MSRVRAGLVMLSIGLLSVMVIPPQWLFVRFWPAAARRFPNLYFRMVARLMGMRVFVNGQPVSRRACLYVANHLSWLDVIVLSSVQPMCFIAKKEVAAWPLFGWLATVGRTLYIDRERRHDVRSSHDAMQKRFAGREIVTLFPEGTSSDGNRVLPFRSALMGAAEMEVQGEPVHVQPVTVAYTGVHGIPLGRVRRPIFAWYGKMDLLSHLIGVGAIGPFEATLTFHPGTSVRQFGGRKELARHCENIIRTTLVECNTGRKQSAVPTMEKTR